MTKWIMMISALVALLGCSDDTATSGTSMNNVTTDTTVRSEAPKPDQPESCAGCYERGVCKAGTERLSCGGGGTMCQVCPTGARCENGECVAPRNCRPDTCIGGCCDENDECVQGTSNASCGSGGAACESCLDGAMCVDQQCETRAACGPDNCSGCCDAAGVCISSGALTACGIGGAACQDCTAINGATCTDGSCVSPTCGQTCNGCCDGDTCIATASNAQCGASGNACMACPDDQTCTNGACVPNTTQSTDLWDIEIIDGEVDARNYDVFSSPDAYLDVYFTDPATNVPYYYGTSEDSNTYFPQWNETISRIPTDLILNEIVFEMWDLDNGIDLDDEICTMTVTPTMADLGGPIITTICAADPSVYVRWRIVPHTP